MWLACAIVEVSSYRSIEVDIEKRRLFRMLRGRAVGGYPSPLLVPLFDRW